MRFIYQHRGWPDFKWDVSSLSSLLAEVRNTQGRLLGRMDGLGLPLRAQATLTTLTADVTKSSAIEGEFLNQEQVRSSIARKLGLDVAGMVSSSRDIDGIVEMMLDATQNFQQPLTCDRLFAWQAALFPTGRSGMTRITVGRWRTSESGPMQVVSGAIGSERVHFEAPAAGRVPQEMERFLLWLEQDQGIDSVLKAGIAHFWFVTIHPFEDGNGRIHRFLIHYVLARRGFTPKDAILPVSAVILARPREYDAALEAFSIPVVERLVYEIDSVGVLQVRGDSASLYRHMDLTVQAEALYRWVQHTIREELPRELRFVRAFHDAFASVHAEIELPDRVLQPLVARTLENKGRLSKARRDRDFKHLEPALLDRAEALVRAAMAAAGLEVEPAPPRAARRASKVAGSTG